MGKGGGKEITLGEDSGCPCEEDFLRAKKRSSGKSKEMVSISSKLRVVHDEL